MNAAPVFERLGDGAVLVRFGSGIDAATNARVHDAAARIAAAGLHGIDDLVPGYASLGVHYDASTWSRNVEGPAFDRVVAALRDALAGAALVETADTRCVEIPVCYGGDFGPDLADVAQRAGIDEDEVVARHARGDYRVAMLGFAPGFPYLLGLDPALQTPRRTTPRTRVAAGSVALGGAQTGIYPRELPGGWNLVGRTPLALFDLARAPASLLAPGDRVRFRAIGRDEFDALSNTDRA